MFKLNSLPLIFTYMYMSDNYHTICYITPIWLILYCTSTYCTWLRAYLNIGALIALVLHNLFCFHKVGHLSLSVDASDIEPGTSPVHGAPGNQDVIKALVVDCTRLAFYDCHRSRTTLIVKNTWLESPFVTVWVFQ